MNQKAKVKLVFVRTLFQSERGADNMEEENVLIGNNETLRQMGNSGRMWGSILMTSREIHINDQMDKNIIISYHLFLCGGNHSEVLLII